MIQKIGVLSTSKIKGKKGRKSRKTRRGYRSIKFSYGHQVAKEKSRSCSAASQTQRKWSQQEKRTIMDQFITIIDQCTVRSTVSIKVYFCSILKTCSFFFFLILIFIKHHLFILHIYLITVHLYIVTVQLLFLVKMYISQHFFYFALFCT